MRYLQVTGDRVKYVGPGTEDKDAAAVRADHPVSCSIATSCSSAARGGGGCTHARTLAGRQAGRLAAPLGEELGTNPRPSHCFAQVPPDCPVYYYEIEIVNRGRDGFIGIGFATHDVKLDRLPGAPGCRWWRRWYGGRPGLLR
jgi:hypothetical protein